MSQYAAYLREDMRLVILRVLNEMPSYTANSSVLSNALGEFGHATSRDVVKSEISWLGEQGLVTITKASDVLVAKLTERGSDVVHARTVVPGVKKPGA